MYKNVIQNMKEPRYVYPVDLSEERIFIDEITEKLGISKAKAIREAIHYYSEYVRGLKVLETREIPKKQAEKEILQYVKKHPKSYTSQIADELNLDLLLVNNILEKLARQGDISGKKVRR